MLLIKLWWSIIAPKNTLGYINKEYLEQFRNTIKKHNTILVHGTGSIWHWFITQYGLSPQTYDIGRKALDTYFQQIDTIIWHERIRYPSKDRSKIKKSSIIWWDITTQHTIISSDTIFAEILAANKNIKMAIIATDVDGVLDQKNSIITTINKDNIHDIHFRSKPWDVTGAMKEKIQQLINHNSWSKKTVRICNGYNLENLNNIIINNKGIWTQILL
jgi:isopentenyl phosphate kinase